MKKISLEWLKAAFDDILVLEENKLEIPKIHKLKTIIVKNLK